MYMSIKNVVVAGGGVLGSQIAFQTAYRGFNVTLWLRSAESIERTKPKIERLRSIYLAELEAAKAKAGVKGAMVSRGLIPDIENATAESIEELKNKVEEAYKNLKYETDLAKAVKDCDLVIESMAENPEAKVDFYTKLNAVLEDKTIVATNSSTMIPSQFRHCFTRPEKYLAIHFANNIWKSNTAEIMGHDGTDKAAYDAVAKFAEDIAMVPLKLQKEQPGYILNSMLVPFLKSGEMLLAKEVADPATIDLTWRLGTGSPLGPFQILDIVGLTTAYNINMMDPLATSDPDSIPAKIGAILKKYIDEGKTGINVGEGFYKYK